MEGIHTVPTTRFSADEEHELVLASVYDYGDANRNQEDDNESLSSESTASAGPVSCVGIPNGETEEISSQEAKSKRRCCGRFCWEWRQPFFGLEEPSRDGGRSPAYLDLEAAFAPHNRKITLFLRGAACAWVVSFLFHDLFWRYAPENRFIYMGYLTQWGLVLACAYLLLSSIGTASASRTLRQPDKPGGSPSLLAKLWWFLFSLAVPLQIALVLLYWTLDYDGQDVSYFNAMKHGVICILLFLDGFGLSNIPVRIKQIIPFMLLTLSFGLWTLVHSKLGIGNGDRESDRPEDPTTNDDVLYQTLNWNDKPTSTSILVAVVVLGVAPVIFMLFWLFSLASGGCRYDGSSRKLYNYSSEAGYEDDKSTVVADGQEEPSTP